jgi:hypothetical protein
MSVARILGGLLQVVGILIVYPFVFKLLHFIEAPSLTGGLLMAGAFILAVIGVVACLVGEVLRTVSYS